MSVEVRPTRPVKYLNLNVEFYTGMTVRTYNLIAVILADGSVDKKRYTVSFTEDEELVKSLIKEFKEIDGIKIDWKIEPQINSCRARAYSKKLVGQLLSFTESFRTRPYNVHPKDPIEYNNPEYPKVKIPDECFKNIENARGFLRHYVSCDGGPEFSVYVRRDRNLIQIHYGIKIGCKNPSLRKQLGKLFKFFQVRTRERDDGLVIENMKNILLFKRKIGFLETTKVRRGKFLRGFYKNDVIKLIILCGVLTQKGTWINKNFESTENLKTFLLNCIRLIKDNQTNNLLDLLFQRLGVNIENLNIIFN